MAIWASVAKACSQQSEVLYGSSFAKTLSLGLCVGWLVPGRHMKKVENLKFASDTPQTQPTNGRQPDISNELEAASILLTSI